MSFSTCSEPQPSMVVAAVPVPITLRKSRRLTPAVPLSALMWDLVMTCRAVVARPERRIGLSDVAVHAPAHVERGGLIHGFHVLHIAVAGLAADAGVDVPHVREVDVLGKLVNANPRNGLLLVPVGSELLDLRLSRGDDGVTPHAGAYSGESWVRRAVRGEVAVEAVHLQRVHVNRVAERYRLLGSVSFRRRGAAVCREHGGEDGDADESGHRQPCTAQVHPRELV